jgi:ubiquinone/menaquinone biosynthesis C-methylase UbiE
MFHEIAMSNSTDSYAMGNTDAEHKRLIGQGARLAPLTERFFREAGIGPGQRVLDLGSGVGDVAMLLARIVAPAGEVVGVERDARAITRARARAAEAGFGNVSFIQAEAGEIVNDSLFDAAAGRFILMFLPKPVEILRSISKLLRPGGVVAFQEVSWKPFLAFAEHLPLWSASLSLIHKALQCAGANTEMGPDLYRICQEAGLSAPAMHLEMPLGNDPNFVAWTYEALTSLRPQIEEHHLSLGKLGDFETLGERLQAEVANSHAVVSWVALVGAYSRKA